MRAEVLNTQSCVAFDSSPMSKKPPIDAISSRSASVRAVLSLVSTWRAMASDRSRKIGHAAAGHGAVRNVHSATNAGAFDTWRGAPWRSEAHGVVTERDTQLADHPVTLDGKLVGEAQRLVVGEVQVDD